MRRPLVAGNWKMNGGLEQAAQLLCQIKAGAQSEGVQLAVFPPFPYLAQTQDLLKDSDIAWGAQTMSQYAGGAYTGEVSPAMLIDFGCSMVILGHSERRQLFAETSTAVAAKAAAAVAANLTPIICLGETLEQRQSEQTMAVILQQLQPVLDKVGKEYTVSQLVIAYEPVWAIGTGMTATPEQAQEVQQFIRMKFAQADQAGADSLKILYGGSVKPDNARELFEMPDIDGALVGGASLQAEQFLAISEAAEEIACNS